MAWPATTNTHGHTETHRSLANSLIPRERGCAGMCMCASCGNEWSSACQQRKSKCKSKPGRGGTRERERERDWGSEMARTEAGREIQNFPIGKHIQHGVKEFRLPFFAYWRRRPFLSVRICLRVWVFIALFLFYFICSACFCYAKGIDFFGFYTLKTQTL